MRSSYLILALFLFGCGEDACTTAETPAPEPEPLTGVSALEARGDSSCALRDGGVYCWGSIPHLKTVSATSQRVAGLESGVTALAMSRTNACAIKAGQVWCWGGREPLLHAPRPIAGLEQGVTDIAVNPDSVCVIQSGAAKCWGQSGLGLGEGMGDSSETPAQVAGLTSEVTAIEASDLGSYCAIHQGGVKCWGYYTARYAQEPTEEEDAFTPVPIRGVEADIEALTISGAHGCALTKQGEVRCWGNAWVTADEEEVRLEAVAVAGLGSVKQLASATAVFTCALQTGGASSVVCWGDPAFLAGEDAAKLPTPTPLEVIIGDDTLGAPTALVMGSTHLCALSGGQARCVGDNRVGQLGDGTTTARTKLTAVVAPEAP